MVIYKFVCLGSVLIYILLSPLLGCYYLFLSLSLHPLFLSFFIPPFFPSLFLSLSSIYLHTYLHIWDTWARKLMKHFLEVIFPLSYFHGCFPVEAPTTQHFKIHFEGPGFHCSNSFNHSQQGTLLTPAPSLSIVSFFYQQPPRPPAYVWSHSILKTSIELGRLELLMFLGLTSGIFIPLSCLLLVYHGLLPLPPLPKMYCS